MNATALHDLTRPRPDGDENVNDWLDGLLHAAANCLPEEFSLDVAWAGQRIPFHFTLSPAPWNDSENRYILRDPVVITFGRNGVAHLSGGDVTCSGFWLALHRLPSPVRDMLHEAIGVARRDSPQAEMALSILELHRVLARTRFGPPDRSGLHGNDIADIQQSITRLLDA